jgi:predicted histidine transporter YuiF (NhaC family)
MFNTAMVIILIVLVVGLVLSFFMVYRNEYTYKRQKEAIEIVCQYCTNLILTDKYVILENGYYDTILVDYDTYMWRLWDWSLKGCFREEYRELFFGKS